MNERKEIYDKLSRILTEYEENLADEEELYSMLVEIQNAWESVITADIGG